MGDVVVLLPGILGSVLERDGKEVWAPTPGAALRALWSLGRSLTGLRLDSDPLDVDDVDGVVATRLMPDVHIIPGLWGIDGYSSISAMITGTFDVVPGQTFIPFPYDWRRDNRVAARQLAAVALPALRRQRQDNPDAKLVLIGHSMGGLVARYFLECLDGWKDTRMLITFGTPYRGSLNAVGFLANGFEKKVGPFKVADL
jgi:pimeloyl-ACP methyl ester carboxylesterase